MKTIEYTTPEIEIIEIEVEQGFAASNGSGAGNTPYTPWTTGF